jgi:hypothetical protein
MRGGTPRSVETIVSRVRSRRFALTRNRPDGPVRPREGRSADDRLRRALEHRRRSRSSPSRRVHVADREPRHGKESRTYALGGTIAAIARLADGKVYVVDHRTTTESIDEGSEYWQRLRLDSQVSDDIVGARSLGYDVAGCYYDVIAKPRLSPLEATPLEKRQYTKKDGRLYAGQRETDETPYEYRARLDASIAENAERYYARAIAPRAEEEETEAALDTWNTARDIREADLALRHPRNPDACKGWGQLCEFFAVCTREVDVNDAAVFGTGRG